MRTNRLRTLKALLVSCLIMACHTTRYVGAACEGDGCALSEEAAACIASELHRDFSVKDLPGVHPEVAICTTRQFSKDKDGLINCRMFWSYLHAEPQQSTVRHSCGDDDFLSQAPESEVFDDDADPDQHCLVRQVTAEQAKSGMAGWYYLDSIPTECPNLGPGVLIPTQRPDETDWQLQLKFQCAATVALERDGSVTEVDPAECVVPSGGDATSVGQDCRQRINLSEYPVVDLGAPACETGICVSVLRPQLPCEPAGSNLCPSTVAHCSCRCAGEPDDVGPFCACPDDYKCKPLLSDFAASPESRGSYCVPADAY
jgi:hypothetical protein